MREKIQQLGGYLAGMIMPAISAFIAWGLLTSFVIPTGWTPNEDLAAMVGPIIVYLLPVLIGFNAGYLVHGRRGGVVGATVTMGVVVGASIPMFLGAMIVGPASAWVVKKLDEVVEGKIRAGFEMLVSNFSAGIASLLMLILAYLVIGPVVEGLSNGIGDVVGWIVDAGLLFFVSVLVEPAKVLFLNNAINFGVFAPLGAIDAAETGKSIFFMIETNPGPGLGILLAYMLSGKGVARASAPGAIIIHFFGGIHEIYFPYILMKPKLILAAIAGGMTGVATNSLLNVGLTATPSPGSIFAYIAVTPQGNFIGMLLGITLAAVVSFLVATVLLRTDTSTSDLEEGASIMASMKG